MEMDGQYKREREQEREGERRIGRGILKVSRIDSHSFSRDCQE